MTISNENLNLNHDTMSLLELNPAEPFTDPLWTVEDVAEYLQLQPETIRNMARKGELPAIKIGKVWRFHRQAIHEMLVHMY